MQTRRGQFDPNRPPSHTPDAPLDASENEDEASLATILGFPPDMSPAFELTDEDGMIRADIYFLEPLAQASPTVSDIDEEFGDDGEPRMSDKESMDMGHLSNTSEDSLIFPFSPSVQATADVADEVAIEPLCLYDFPGLDPHGGDDDAPESEDSEQEPVMHGDLFSPFPRAPWNSDDQDAHIDAEV